MPLGQRETYDSPREPPWVNNNAYTLRLLILWMRAITESPVPTKHLQMSELSVKIWAEVNKVSSARPETCWRRRDGLRQKEAWTGVNWQDHLVPISDLLQSDLSPGQQSVAPEWQHLQSRPEGKEVCGGLKQGCTCQLQGCPSELQVWVQWEPERDIQSCHTKYWTAYKL